MPRLNEQTALGPEGHLRCLSPAMPSATWRTSECFEKQVIPLQACQRPLDTTCIAFFPKGGAACILCTGCTSIPLSCRRKGQQPARYGRPKQSGACFADDLLSRSKSNGVQCKMGLTAGQQVSRRQTPSCCHALVIGHDSCIGLQCVQHLSKCWSQAALQAHQTKFGCQHWPCRNISS